MIVIAFIDVKDGKDKFVLILYELLQQLHIIRVFEVIPSKHVHLIHQVLLAFRQGALWSLKVGTEGQGQRR